ncbi:hypothetical protein E2I00_005491 [Balaenoptera physalus]|uniref:Protein FAM107B n=1 Tax=Balaenoptera physalus TaxID=9770 RepID=A0A643CBU9_BALPH|nr:hypothetical protein E2I00_005491 [Balaenoptera physalus]
MHGASTVDSFCGISLMLLLMIVLRIGLRLGVILENGHIVICGAIATYWTHCSLTQSKGPEEYERKPDAVFAVKRCPLEDSDLKDTYLIPRNIMAEPDYIDDDNPELIRPQKLVNPVKTSRNHQDLHRELLMNQKRGLAPQNKPELQKVMEKRKRDQVIKQKEEEAQKKKSDLEIELLKRQQKLEQLELEKQKLQEEQENAPEFVKVKGNLRRTGQEVAQAQES